MKNPLAIGGANETGTILLFLIIAVWFFTSKRFTAFKKVLASKFEEVKEAEPAEEDDDDDDKPTVISGGDGVDTGQTVTNANVG